MLQNAETRETVRERSVRRGGGETFPAVCTLQLHCSVLDLVRYSNVSGRLAQCLLLLVLGQRRTVHLQGASRAMAFHSSSVNYTE